MAGLLTHLIIVVVLSTIIWISFKHWLYAAAFALGHLIPDLISFGIPGIKIGSMDPSVIMTNSLFHPLALFSHNAFNWIIILLVIWLIVVVLYSFKKIEQKKFADLILGMILFIIAVTLHLIVDKMIIETNYWI